MSYKIYGHRGNTQTPMHHQGEGAFGDPQKTQCKNLKLLERAHDSAAPYRILKVRLHPGEGKGKLSTWDL